MTHKDQEIDQVVRKICKTSDELKYGGMPQCRTHKDQEIDRAVRKYTKDLINLRMWGMPQCRIVTQHKTQNVTIQNTLGYAQ